MQINMQCQNPGEATEDADDADNAARLILRTVILGAPSRLLVSVLAEEMTDAQLEELNNKRRGRTQRGDGELQRRLKLGNVWVFVQLIRRPRGPDNQLYETQTLPNLRLLTTSGELRLDLSLKSNSVLICTISSTVETSCPEAGETPIRDVKTEVCRYVRSAKIKLSFFGFWQHPTSVVNMRRK